MSAALLEKAFLSAGAKQETFLTPPEPWGPPHEPERGVLGLRVILL